MPQSARHPSTKGANGQIPASTKNGGPTQQPCSIRLNMLFRRVRIFFLPHDASSPQYPPSPDNLAIGSAQFGHYLLVLGLVRGFFFKVPNKTQTSRRHALLACWLKHLLRFSLSTPSIYLPIHLPIYLPAYLSISLGGYLDSPVFVCTKHRRTDQGGSEKSSSQEKKRGKRKKRNQDLCPENQSRISQTN